MECQTDRSIRADWSAIAVCFIGLVATSDGEGMVNRLLVTYLK